MNETLKRRSHCLLDLKEYVITYKNNPEAMEALYGMGLAPRKKGMTAEECAAITNNDFKKFPTTLSKKITHFDEFLYFTSVTTRGTNYPLPSVNCISFPNGFKFLGYTIGSHSSTKYITDRITFVGNAIIEKMSGNNYIVGNRLTNYWIVNLLQVFGNLSSYGYNNTNGNNSFNCVDLRKIQIAGTVSNWWAFGDIGVSINNLVNVYPDIVVPHPEFDIELIDENGNVVQENDYYKKVNGNIYSKDGTILYYYNKQAQTITIGSEVTKLEKCVFSLMPNITSIIVPSTVLTICDGAFHRLSNLRELYINGLNFVDVSFTNNLPIGYCPKLEKLMFNTQNTIFSNLDGLASHECSNIKLLGFGVETKNFTGDLSGLTGLEKLYLPYNGICTWNSSLTNMTCSVYVPDDKLNTYKTTTGWQDISDRIKPISEFNETISTDEI